LLSNTGRWLSNFHATILPPPRLSKAVFCKSDEQETGDIVMKLFLATAALAAALSVPVVPALAESASEVLKGDVNATSQGAGDQTETNGMAKAKVKEPAQMKPAAGITAAPPGTTLQDKTDAVDKGK
jgi:hypothetical protein